MSPNKVRFYRESFSGYQGFRIVAYTRRLDVITDDEKRHEFLEEKEFLKFAGAFLVESTKERN